MLGTFLNEKHPKLPVGAFLSFSENVSKVPIQRAGRDGSAFSKLRLRFSKFTAKTQNEMNSKLVTYKLHLL